MCSIAAAAAKSGAERYILLKSHIYCPYLRVLGLHPPVALDNQVILRLTIHSDALLSKQQSTIERLCRAHFINNRYFQLVVQPVNRHKNGLQVMVTIFTLAHYAQT